MGSEKSLLGVKQSSNTLRSVLRDTHFGPFLDNKAGERPKLNKRAEKMLLETFRKRHGPGSCYGSVGVGGSLFTDKFKRLKLKFQMWGRD